MKGRKKKEHRIGIHFFFFDFTKLHYRTGSNGYFNVFYMLSYLYLLCISLTASEFSLYVFILFFHTLEKKLLNCAFLVVVVVVASTVIIIYTS